MGSSATLKAIAAWIRTLIVRSLFSFTTTLEDPHSTKADAHRDRVRVHCRASSPDVQSVVQFLPPPPLVRPLAFAPALLEPLMELALFPPAAALPPDGSG